MMTRQVAVNHFTEQSISEYRWPLNLAESYYDMLEQDLRDIEDENWMVKVGDKLIDSKEIDYDFNFDDNYKQVQAETFWKEIEWSIPNLKEILAKYGITLDYWKIWQPREYNFEDDELLMEYSFDDTIDWREKYPELIPAVQYYIDNVRVKSYDGYVSFEPSEVEMVEMDDSAYVYAIFYKEWLLDDLKQGIEDGIYTINECAFENLNDSWYEYDWKKYHLSLDEKKLYSID